MFTASTKTTTAGLSHLATVHYNRRALSTKKKRTHFWRLGRPDDLPLQNGKTAQWFRPTEFGANTTATAEGEPSSGLALQSSTISATVAQYSDVIALSDFLVQTDIVSSLDMATERLSYRAALSMDGIYKTELDATATDQPLLGDYLAATDLARTRFEFAGADVEPFEGSYHRGIFHPHCLYDLMLDPQAGGFQDLSKHMDELKSKNISIPDRGYIGKLHNVEIYESSNATQIAGTPNKWRNYIAGFEAFGILRLAGKGPKNITNPDRERFNLNIVRNDGNQLFDAEKKIAAAVAYNVKVTAKTLDATRLRKIDAPSGIVA